MNRVAEDGIVHILTTAPGVSALVGDRVTWDDDEIDITYDSITLRTLVSAFPAADMAGQRGIRQSRVEVTARSQTRLGATNLADAIVNAVNPFEGGTTIVDTSTGSVIFGAIKLEDVQQAPSIQQRSYRKLLVYSVTYYE